MNDISKLEGIHAGGRCFVIGNGPSLAVKDLDRLRNEVTFACNNIYLAFPDTVWRPTYYTISDPLAAKTYAATIKTLPGVKIFSDSVNPFFLDTTDIIWLRQIHYARDDDSSDFAFSFDLNSGVYHGASTLYIQFQIALFMGIEEVYLLGVDFDYKPVSKIRERSGLGVMIEDNSESNHFHKNYRQPGEQWWLADCEFQEKTFRTAQSAFEANNRRILNASRKTKLTVVPQVDFDSIL